MERDTAYNDQDQPVDYTTKNAAGVILSQVQDSIDGNGEITSQAQSHSGAVTGGTSAIGYGYTETAGGQERQSSMTYVNGRQITFEPKISRGGGLASH